MLKSRKKGIANHNHNGLAGNTDNYEVMRMLGLKTAKRLGLNYFDIHDVSPDYNVPNPSTQKQMFLLQDERDRCRS